MARLSITQSAFTGGEWSETLWHRTTHEQYMTSMREAYNVYAEIQGTLKKRTGSVYAGASPKAQCTFFEFELSDGNTCLIEFSNLAARFWEVDGRVEVATVPVEVVTPYTTADLPYLRFKQIEDRLIITSNSYPVKIMTRASKTSWSITDAVFGASISAPTGLSSSGGSTYTLKVSAVTIDGEESVPSASSVTANAASTLSWTAVSGADRYYIYQYNNGLWQQKAIVGTNSYTVTTDTPDPDKGPYTAYNYFGSSNNYPLACAFYQQRSVFANTNNNRKRIALSSTGQILSFNSSSPKQDDDAIVFNPADEGYNPIMHLVGVKSLIAMGTKREYVVSSANGDSSAITPTSIKAEVQSSIGCGHVRPIVVANSVLFFDYSQKHLNQFSYSLTDDGYIPSSLTVLAEHIFKDDRAVYVSYSANPTPRLFVITEAGKLWVLVYSREHKIVGWYQWATDGVYEAVGVMQRPGLDDRIYVATLRDGVRYIEYFADEDFTDETSGFYLDCGGTYDGTATTTITGLARFNGGTISALIDGMVAEDIEVSGGSATLPFAGEKVHYGLPYEARIRSVSPAVPSADSQADKNGSIISITLRLKDSRELLYGKSLSDLNEYILRGVDDGDATDLFSGMTQPLSIGGDNSLDPSVYVASQRPVPMNIQSITYHIEKNDA